MLGPVDQPHEHGQRDKQHRPDEERRHGEDGKAAGRECRCEPAPARQARDDQRASRPTPSTERPALDASVAHAAARGCHLVVSRLGGGAGSRGARSARLVDPDLLQAARVGVEHLELQARGMAHELAAHGHAPQQRKHEAAERVDVLLLLGLQKLEPQVLLELLDGRARRGDEPELRLGGDMRGLGDVVLVLDVADDLLDQILDGDEAVGAAVLVDDQRHVDAGRLHADEQVGRRHGGGNVEHRPADLRHRDRSRKIDAAEVEMVRSAFLGLGARRRRSRRRRAIGALNSSPAASLQEPAEQILDVDHAARIIERLAEQRNARHARFAEHAQAAPTAARFPPAR